MKKSVIAAVAASNMTIFSGLVNAANDTPSPPGCKFTVRDMEEWEGGVWGWIEDPEMFECNASFPCGPRLEDQRCGNEYDPNFPPDPNFAQDAQVLRAVYIKCGETKSCLRDGIEPGVPGPDSNVWNTVPNYSDLYPNGPE